jgi:hypothetical protein
MVLAALFISPVDLWGWNFLSVSVWLYGNNADKNSHSGLWVYNLEGACFSETLVSVYKLKQGRIPKDHNLDTQWNPEELHSLSQLRQLFLKPRLDGSVFPQKSAIQKICVD